MKIHRLETAARICTELDRAYAKHGDLPWGRHEFYAILKEEVDELWDAIKSDEPDEQVHKEAIHVAAMVFRYLETGDRYRTDKSHPPAQAAAKIPKTSAELEELKSLGSETTPKPI